MDVTKVGIVGLGRWAKVLTRAAAKSEQAQDRRGLQPLGRKSARRSRGSSASRRRPTSQTMLADPAIKGVILTVPERAASAARARGRQGRQARLHREADRQHAGGGARDRGAARRRYGVTVTVGHSARLMAGIRHDPRGDRRRRARPRRLHGGEFLQRARARAHPADLALVQGPRARRPAVAARHPSVRRAALSRRRDRRGELDGLEALAGRRRGRRPVDDAAEVRRRQDRLCRLVLDLARRVLPCACSAPRG